MATKRACSPLPTGLYPKLFIAGHGRRPAFWFRRPCACHSEERFGDEESRSTTPVVRGAGSRQSSRRSFHCAFIDSISAIFFDRLHPLICFSRAMAARTSLVASKYTKGDVRARRDSNPMPARDSSSQKTLLGMTISCSAHQYLGDAQHP